MRKLFIFTSILILLIISSCQQGPGEEVLGTDFKNNYIGEVVIDLIPLMPPEKVHEDSDFRVGTYIRNQGGYKATNVELTLVGFDEDQFYYGLNNGKQYFDFAETLKTIGTLEGKRLENSQGDFDRVEYLGRTKTLPEGQEQISFNYGLILNYHYSNELVQEICINPKFYDVSSVGCQSHNVDGQDVRLEDGISLIGQGSPLGVKEMEVVIHPGDKPTLEVRFDVKNLGQGIAKNIQLNLGQLITKPMKCEVKQKNFRDEQEATIVCNFNLNDQSSYTAPVYLKFEYDYELTMPFPFNFVE